MFGSDMGGFGERGGPALVDRFGRSLRDSLRIAQPVSGQLTMGGGETSINLGAPPVSGSLQVYRNRVLVHPSVYTLSGLTLALNGGKKFYQSDIVEIYYLSLYPPRFAATLPVTPSYLSQVMADRPIGYWRANEASGTTMFDSSGNGNHATYGANALLNQTALYPGNSACVGITTLSYAAKIAGPTGALLSARTGPWTLECIVKATSPYSGSSTGWILAYDKGGNPTSPTPMLGMTYFGAPGVHDQVTSYYSSEVYSPNHTGGSLVHLALVYDGGSTWTLYENGAQAWTGGVLSQSGSVDNIWFLGNSQGSVNGFTGYGSDFAIYNTALSPTRIAAHYNAMIAGTILGDRDPYLRTVDLSASNSPSANLVASVDPTDPTQFKFVPNSGGGSAMTRLFQTIVSGSAASTIDWNSIPQGYTDLLLVITGRDTSSSISSGGARVQLNADTTTTNYQATILNSVNGASVATNVPTITSNGATFCGIPGTSGNSNPVGQGWLRIADYANSNFYKVMTAEYNYYYGSTPSLEHGKLSSVWKSTSPITRITLYPPGTAFAIGTTATLYGLT